MYLVLEVDQEGMNATEAQDALQRVKEILYNRIDKFGVSEPEITTFGTSRIVVKLPGLQDPERAKNLLGKTAQLEFRMVRPAEDIAGGLETSWTRHLPGRVRRRCRSAAAGAATDVPADVPDAAPAAEETAAAIPDSADPFGDFDDVLGADQDTAREEYLVEHPFSGLLIAQPGLRRARRCS